MIKKFLKPLLFVLPIILLSCQSERKEDDGTLSETHPKLEKQLDRKSVKMPISDSENPDLYQSYQITMEEYHNSGEFSVSNIYKGRLAPLDVKSHADIENNREDLERGLKNSVNFAGKYTVVTINCGANCQHHFIVDRESGKVTDKLQSSIGAAFNPNSRLFIVNPAKEGIDYSGCTQCAPQAFVLEKGKFKKLEKSPN